jgi:hypothetical protein|tara:strand:- start:1286 stop:1585 length:300 start_codon:yes stop_codon:yes gene_type:complete
MSPEVFAKWEHIVDSVEKTKIPLEFIKKLVIKLNGRRQRTINIKSLFNQGLESDEIEQAITRKLDEYDDDMVGIEFVLDIEGIAEIVQPEIDDLLKSVK